MELSLMDGENVNSKITSHQFFNSIKLLIEKPHVVNKKVCGFELKWIGIAKGKLNIDQVCTELESVLHVENSHLENAPKVESTIESLFPFGFETIQNGVKCLEKIPWISLSSLPDPNSHIAIIRNIIPKSGFIGIEVIIMDGHFDQIMFIAETCSTSPQILPEVTYTLQLNQQKIQLDTMNCKNEHDSSLKWLRGCLLPTLTKWAIQMSEESSVNITSSIRLVNIEHYSKTYQNLKEKYGPFLKKIWTETTDPLKFIHEDIAIASYLLVLWEQERREKNLTQKQSFVDLGCGNGLLVYLLSTEGHPGMGIDIKRRKLWDQFPNYVSLKEDVILPSDRCLYPDYDWLIGNHSDELTPWIPVIAAKSSMFTRFFVIPCCAHDFQSKFQRKRGGLSQYAEYLDYIEQVGSECGFQMWKDRLRIPSTKRTCFVGQNRTYGLDKWNDVKREITEFVNTKCSSAHDGKEKLNASEESHSAQESWCREFKAREAIQKTRNCTQINSEIRDEIVNKIGFFILSDTNYIKVEIGDKVIQWNKGGKISMKSLVEVLSSDLKHLKNECGGLQTLLRNHKFLFKIEEGYVHIRVPEPVSARYVSPDLLRTKKCWFNTHHPQGCILKSEDCTYLH